MSGKWIAMRLLALLFAGVLLSSCASTTHTPRGVKFSLQSPRGGESPSAAPQTGKRDSITLKNFREATFAQGSWGCFDVIRIRRNGTGYGIVATNEPVGRGTKVSMRWTEAQLRGLIDAMNEDRVARLERDYYVSWMVDGTEGFVEIVKSSSRITSRFRNNFSAIHNTLAYCNREFWPEINARVASAGEVKPMDSYQEYTRVFPKKP